MSLVHTRLGASGWKFRLSKFGAIARSCLLPVVTTNLRFPRALMPCTFMSRRTRSFQTRTLLARSSRQILGQPYSPLAFCMYSLDINQQSSIADALAGNRWIIRNSSSTLMFKVIASTNIEHFALPGNRPTAFMPFNPGRLHTDSRAKYAVGDSMDHCNIAKIFSAGVKKFNVFLGRSFSSFAIKSSCSCE